MTNFIQHTSGVLSKPECDAVIDFFEINEQRQEVGKMGSDFVVDPKRKIDTEMLIDVKELVGYSILNPVAKALQTTCEEYNKNYPFLKEVEDWIVYKYFKIKRL